MESALYGVYTLVVLYQKLNKWARLTCSISDTPELVCKHRTRALSMKYSICILHLLRVYYANSQLPVGLITVEHCSGFTDVMGSNPDCHIFFQASSFQLLKLENLLRWSFFTLMIKNSFNIRDKQRYRQTITKGEVTFRLVIVGRPTVSVYASIYCVWTHATQICTFRTNKSKKILRQDI